MSAIKNMRLLTKQVTLTVEETGLAVVMVDGSGAVLVDPLVNSSVTAPNMETPPTGAFPFNLSALNIIKHAQ